MCFHREMKEDQPDGGEADRSGRDDVDASRLQAIESTICALTGTFPPGYLEELRQDQDWPD